MNDNEIRLTLPALPEYVRLARLTVAALATRVGFNYDEVEDLRIAVGEACTLVSASGGPESLLITFVLDTDAISVEVQGSPTRPPESPPRSSADGASATSNGADTATLSEQILTAVIDQYRFDPAAGSVWISKQLTSA